MKYEGGRMKHCSDASFHPSSFCFHPLLLPQSRARLADGEALASAGAACRNHFASAFGLHAFEETVRAGAFFAFGLVYSLNHDNSLGVKIAERIIPAKSRNDKLEFGRGEAFVKLDLLSNSSAGC
jgi:hypothetical protein